jgi:hypothetical protein
VQRPVDAQELERQVARAEVVAIAGVRAAERVEVRARQQRADEAGDRLGPPRDDPTAQPRRQVEERLARKEAIGIVELEQRLPCRERQVAAPRHERRAHEPRQEAQQLGGRHLAARRGARELGPRQVDGAGQQREPLPFGARPRAPCEHGGARRRDVGAKTELLVQLELADAQVLALDRRELVHPVARHVIAAGLGDRRRDRLRLGRAHEPVAALAAVHE